ncbi:S8 family serine peptidase [Flavobacterium sp. AS60]|uniref:S8 family serine peptidase n=1 Tax=Flavobacterium anseongense TaxID=2910677 RepID=UPI001F35A248|nr:S8 family serine peptidase [Flavobacterium sp. AS60]MCF6130408.1 S8 family serine peptidase [Flavobacterium sp. AS60]
MSNAMNKRFLIVCFLLSLCGYSQEDAWVYFNDKPNAAAQLSTPLNFLTQRALDRRTNQGILLNENDVPIHQDYIDGITAAPGITVKAKSKWLNCLHVRGTISDINALTLLPYVNRVHFADASLNSKQPRTKTINPVNKHMDVLANFNYGNSNNQIEMLNGHLLHQANYTGTGKIIAVLDSGFINVNSTAPFQRLFDNNLILGGYNFVSRDVNVYSLHNHGTMTLSCMGGYVDGELVGTAPDAQYYLYVTEDISQENPVEESYWVEAAEEADRVGADIISTSLGYYKFDDTNYGHNYSEFTGDTAFASKGANIAFSKGIVVVASAGNSGSSAEPLNHVGVPAEALHVLAVGAVKSDETYATFSSIGPSFDGRIKPDVMAKGQASVVANTSGNIQTASGTSFSCPIISGMIASFWQAIPWATNQQVVDFVKQSADRYVNPNNQFGYGIPDFQLALNNALSVNHNSGGRFLVHPNPVQDNLFVSFPDGFQEAKISLYNAIGQIVFEKNIQNTDVSLSLNNINSGIYFYKLNSNSFVQTGKIIKN